MTKKLLANFLVGCCTLLLTTCGPTEATHGNVVRQAFAELPVGSAAVRVETFFKKRHLPITFDAFTNRYICNLRSRREGEGTLIQVYLDRNHRLRKIIVDNYTTAP